MGREIELAINPENIQDEQHIRLQGAKKLNVPPSTIKGFKIRKRSIDARSKKVVFRVKVIFFLEETPAQESFEFSAQPVHSAPSAVIVGAGPAGLFAALRCIELGIKPIIIERGKDVQKRRRDLALLNRDGLVDEDSNYCFGEGGAGTYSDGKLYTRADKRGNVQRVLQWFVAHGAPADILVDARPHIGTNKLPHIIRAIRETILDRGGEIHFETRLTDIRVKAGHIESIALQTGERIPCRQLILATGHSARDIFYLFENKGWLLEAKPFALGVRIEHPQEIIDRAQYHCDVRSEHLPPAYYNLVQQIEDKGVFSFCMCPGGVIAPCATQEGEIVVNGWSPSKRNNPHANSGTVVQVEFSDVPEARSDAMALLRFQARIEQKAFAAGGGNQVAPGQRMVDFVEGKLSKTLPDNSYKPGVRAAMLEEILPDFVANSLKKALPLFGKKMKGYYTNEALLVGVESRTSSPVRIPRDKETLQHPQIKGLFPCGEGAGYAGGILSAAIDGINCAEKLMKG